MELHSEHAPDPSCGDPLPVRREEGRDKDRLLTALVVPAREDKTYYGRRNADGSCSVWIGESHAALLTKEGANEPATRDLPLCLEVRNHSPTGFEWGYSGSGPAQLALALLVNATGDVALAERHYQEFKREVIASLPVQSWTLSSSDILRFVARTSGGDSESAKS